jgi:predicted extracellular nuclease
LDGNKITFTNVDVEQTVLLTATLTYSYVGIDPIVTTKDFTLTVSPITVVTDISTLNAKTVDAWTIANDTYVYVEGVVTGNYISYGSEAGTFIQDAEGNGIYVHGLKSQTIGDKIVIYGKLGEYGSVRQMSSSVRKLVISTGNEIVVTTMTPAELEAILPNYYEFAGMVIEVTGLVVKEYRTNGYLDIFWIDDATDYLLSIYYNTDAYSWMSSLFPAASTLPKIQFTLYNIYSTYSYNITNLIVERTADQDVALDADKLPATLSLNEDYIIPNPTFGSTYTVTAVSAELTAYIDYTSTPGTLVVTQPETEDAVGTITITVSKTGATDELVVIAVTVVNAGAVQENTPVIIYEAYGGGGNSGSTYKNDYIVLYNTTDAAIDLSTYSIQYSSATGTTWSKTNLTGTIAAGGYYLIQEAAGTGGTTDLPTPDVIGTIAMSGTGFKLALVSSQTALSGADPTADPTVVDFVGCNTANAFETAVAPAPSNSTSIKRTSFIDTDNNSVDFVAVATNLSYLEA